MLLRVPENWPWVNNIDLTLGSLISCWQRPAHFQWAGLSPIIISPVSDAVDKARGLVFGKSVTRSISAADSAHLYPVCVSVLVIVVGGGGDQLCTLRVRIRFLCQPTRGESEREIGIDIQS